MGKQIDNVNQPAGKSLPASGDDLLELVHTVMHQVRSQQYQALRDGPLALTHMESKVLGFYAHRPGATQSDLVQHTGRDKAQLARLIKGLRERGLLHGEADAADRRNVRLQLTPEGQAIQQALRQQAKALEAQAVLGLAEEEKAQLLALLRRVQGNLSA